MSRIAGTFVTLGLSAVMGSSYAGSGLRARPNGPASARAAFKAMGTVSARRFRRTDVSSASIREATTLVAGDTNKRTTSSSAIARLAHRADRQLGRRPDKREQRFPVFSADGRFVAFDSEATNLVPNDTNGVRDVFIRDRKKGTTERISVSSGGIQGDYGGSFPAISGDGRFVVFSSEATNLVAADTNGFASDVFIRDRKKARPSWSASVRAAFRAMRTASTRLFPRTGASSPSGRSPPT